MSKLTALRGKIAALEAEFARTAKVEMDASVGKVKAMMASLGVSLEHLGSSSPSAAGTSPTGRRAYRKKAETQKRVGAGVAKFADPKTGKTWTGFGRAPAWIAEAKNRDDFLVSKAAVATTASATVPTKPSKKPKAKRAIPTKKVSAAAVKKAAPAKAPVTKKAAAKKSVSAKASAAKKAVSAKAPAAKKAVVAKTPVAKKAAAKKPAVKKAEKKKVVASKAPASQSTAANDSAGAAAS